MDGRHAPARKVTLPKDDQFSNFWLFPVAVVDGNGFLDQNAPERGVLNCCLSQGVSPPGNASHSCSTTHFRE